MTAFRRIVAAAVFGVVGSAALGQLQGTIESVTFQGPITGGPVRCSVYLPAGYDPAGPALPVIYHLHGLGGSSQGPAISTVPESYEAARTAGLIGPAIIVFADGYTNSFWADSATSNKPAETNVALELVPWMDAHYRTIADRSGRVIHGFSMGGFGTEKFACKFPELFSVAVNYDGAMLTWDRLVQSHPEIAHEIFNDDEAYFDQYSPWFWSGENAKALAAGTAFRTVVGVLETANREFRGHLQALGIAVDYVETNLPHSLDALMEAEGDGSWAFIASHLGLVVCGADWDHNGVVNSSDVSGFINDWFIDQRTPRQITDVNGDGASNSTDVSDFVNRWFENLAAGCGE